MEGTRLRGVGGLCRIRFTLDRIKASPEATGRALQKAMRWRSHAQDFSAPQGRAAANVIRDRFRGLVRSLVRWSGRSEEAPVGAPECSARRSYQPNGIVVSVEVH